MDMEMDELQRIAPLRGPRPEGAAAVKRKVSSEPSIRLAGAHLPRRSLLRGAVVSATALGMTALGVFPAARRAYADGYDVYGACPSYAANHNRSPGCGPSSVQNDCCASSGYFRNGQPNNAHTATCYLRPNQCYQSRYDAWIWLYNAACDRCGRFIEFRCHDGIKVFAGPGAPRINAICRWITRCG